MKKRSLRERISYWIDCTMSKGPIAMSCLASQARVDDFVIGSNFASLIMAQISENPNIMPLIDDLLDESGSELYI